MVNKWVKMILITVAALLVACVVLSGLYAFGAIKVKPSVPDNQSGEQTAQETQPEQSGTLLDGLNLSVIANENHSFNPEITVNVHNMTITVKPSEAMVQYLRDKNVSNFPPDIDVGYKSFATGRTQGANLAYATLDEFALGSTIKIFDLRYFDYSDVSDVRFTASISFGSMPEAGNNSYYSETPRYNLAAYTVQDFEDAYNEGEKDGFYDGYGKGKTDGQAEGEAKGFDNGYAARDGEAKAYLSAMTLNDYISANGTATIVFLSSLGALILYLSGLLIAFAVRYFRGC